MDHIPIVDGGRMQSLEVPYLVTERWAYDGNGIHGFPQRVGMDVKRLQRGDLQGREPVECLKFAQAWLFFGFVIDIFSVLGFRLEPRDFVKTQPNGTQVITSELFPKLVIAWEIMERGVFQADKQKRLDQIDSIIAVASGFVNASTIADWTELPSGTDSEAVHSDIVESRSDVSNLKTSVKIELSILWLGETISHARSIPYLMFNRPNILDWRSERRPQLRRETFAPWKRHTALKSLLTDAGWCPFEIELRLENATNSTNWYCANFDRGQELEDHQNCTTAACVLNFLVKENYRTRHVAEHCQCPLLRSTSSDLEENSRPRDTLENTVLEQHIPLALVYGSVGREELQIVSSQRKGILAAFDHSHRKSSRARSAQWPVYDHEAKPVVRYVAISHVWRGGLGNPHSNALPRCQLARIQALVNAQYPAQLQPIPFWMDTLCVPLQAPLRKIAIQQMKSIYQEADKVLVLDNALQSASLASDALVNLCRIGFCSWTQRLWTYQEGVLAFRLVFQFRDGSVMGEDLVRQQEEDGRRFYRDNLDQIRRMIKSRTIIKANMDGFILRWVLGGLSSLARVDHPWIGRGTTLPKQVDRVNYEARRSFKALRIAHSEYTGTFIRKDRDFQALSAISVPLQWRRTTKAKDEALVLANLMGLDLKKLLDPRRELTLRHVFQHLESAPLDVLFLNKEHFDEQGCRWMPRSLIDGRGFTMLSRQPGKVTSHGLVVELPSIFVMFRDIPSLNEKSAMQISGKWYEIKTTFTQPSEVFGDDESGASRVAIVYKNLKTHTPFSGAVLRNVRDDVRRLVATWYGCVRISPTRPDSGTPPTMRNVDAHVLHKTREWCIE
ncbi:hypothetical protein FB567DRAFT_250319 [Paraphoma chrysanthemicola]|uniref:Heterokaryon incompatibility domain-containing protein n=1 Tax=Paraphoma chrysanthemicola TaxID=798071 RepID=A0A8K0QRM5_9PLEO|nr:hypothetical protein FB567DRAFT_250319 [Paraphoma chrysanthemicola]